MLVLICLKYRLYLLGTFSLQITLLNNTHLAFDLIERIYFIFQYEYISELRAYEIIYFDKFFFTWYRIAHGLGVQNGIFIRWQ